MFLPVGYMVVDAVCSNEGLTLETSAAHYIPQVKNIPYQPLLIKLIFNLENSTANRIN